MNQCLEEIVQLYEWVQADASGTREAARVAAVNGSKDRQRRQANDSKGRPNGNKLATLDGKCYRCGSTTHRAKECRIDKSILYKNCNVKGHLAIVCQSTAKANVAQMS